MNRIVYTGEIIGNEHLKFFEFFKVNLYIDDMIDKFILGDEAVDVSKKSIRALRSRKKGTKPNKGDEYVYLVINLTSPVASQSEYAPRIIPLTHKLRKLDDCTVLLITKDPSTPYRDALVKKGSPSEDVFNDIFSLKKLKSIARDPRKAYKLYKEHDLVVADNRVYKFLPGILGATFFEKKSRSPYMVQMARPDANATLVKGKRSTKLKDERCEPKYVVSQLKSIVGNTSFVPSAKTNALMIKVGISDWKSDKIIENIHDTLSYLLDQKFRPVGGIIKSKRLIQSIYIKTSDSINLPILEPKATVADSSDSDED